MSTLWRETSFYSRLVPALIKHGLFLKISKILPAFPICGKVIAHMRDFRIIHPPHTNIYHNEVTKIKTKRQKKQPNKKRTEDHIYWSISYDTIANDARPGCEKMRH